jgi:hypothetical protein
MAIYEQKFMLSGTNANDLVANHDWATALRVRMTELQEFKYGALNTIRIVNNSAQDATLSFSFDVARSKSFLLKGNSVLNITIEDGIAFYGFDVYSADAANDISAGDIKYNASVVEQVRE